MRSLKNRVLALAAVLTLCVVGAAYAQVTFVKSGTGLSGIVVPVTNTVDSLIYEGELVMIDTTATTKRIGVKRYDGTALGRFRIVGIATANIKKSSQGGAGNVLIWGYHPRAHAVKALAAGVLVRPGAINGSLAAGGDSASMAVGRVLTGVAGATNKDNARYGIWFWGGTAPGKVHVTL